MEKTFQVGKLIYISTYIKPVIYSTDIIWPPVNCDHILQV